MSIDGRSRPRERFVSERSGEWRVSADVGGTFTDILVLSADRRLTRIKTPSTTSDYSQAIVTALRQSMTHDERKHVRAVVHGTTVATNAILEEAPSEVALITTRGFRDVLEMRRGRRPSLYDLTWTPPTPIVGRDLRLEVGERIDKSGDILEPLVEADVEAIARSLLERRIEAVGICLLNSYANRVHETKVKSILRDLAPEVLVTCSSDLVPEPKEYERTSTTAVNGYLLPIVSHYLTELQKSLEGADITAPVQIMQSDGTCSPLELVKSQPFRIIESGPAAGVIGAAQLAEEMSREHVVTFDMGGTTAKAGLVENFEVRYTEELEVGASHNHGSSLTSGFGHVVRSPCVDLSEVGSGGGSIAWVDGGGALRVGPRSAGAEPGPACYGLGGVEPTVTDAHVVLGYLNSEQIAGGTRRIDPDLAALSVDTLACKMRVSREEAAHRIYRVATANMRRAVRAVSIERGHDPRQFSLIAFGGGGGLHAASLAAELEMPEVIVPPVAGLFSSLGLLFANPAVTKVESCRVVLHEDSLPQLLTLAAKLSAEAKTELASAYVLKKQRVEASLALRYVGQAYSILVPFELGGLVSAEIISKAFHVEHARMYGHASPGSKIEIDVLRVRVLSNDPKPSFAEIEGQSVTEHVVDAAPRPAYFGDELGWLQTTLTSRAAVIGRMEGPLIIEEPETTIVVPPGHIVEKDVTHSLVITRV